MVTRLESLFVCVIDADENARITLKTQLENSGCIVLAASCSKECERLLKDYEYDPDLIIRDTVQYDQSMNANILGIVERFSSVVV
jgi:CheY-like chemotaxis protein